jgi:hypothetical protein
MLCQLQDTLDSEFLCARLWCYCSGIACAMALSATKYMKAINCYLHRCSMRFVLGAHSMVSHLCCVRPCRQGVCSGAWRGQHCCCCWQAQGVPEHASKLVQLLQHALCCHAAVCSLVQPHRGLLLEAATLIAVPAVGQPLSTLYTLLLYNVLRST